MDLEIEADQAALPALALAFHTIAATMYLELAKTRGPGAWIDELRTRIRYEVSTIEAPDGLDDETLALWDEAKQTAVDHIFEYVTFEPKPQKR